MRVQTKIQSINLCFFLSNIIQNIGKMRYEMGALHLDVNSFLTMQHLGERRHRSVIAPSRRLLEHDIRLDWNKSLKAKQRPNYWSILGKEIVWKGEFEPMEEAPRIGQPPSFSTSPHRTVALGTAWCARSAPRWAAVWSSVMGKPLEPVQTASQASITAWWAVEANVTPQVLITCH